jgi:hypothetical protein
VAAMADDVTMQEARTGGAEGLRPQACVSDGRDACSSPVVTTSSHRSSLVSRICAIAASGRLVEYFPPSQQASTAGESTAEYERALVGSNPTPAA